MPWSNVSMSLRSHLNRHRRNARRGPKDTTRSRACVVLYRGRRLPQNMSRANDTGFCRVLLKENGSALRYAHKLPDCYNPCVRAPGGTFWSRLRIPPAALFLFFSGNASKWLCCLAVMMAYALLSYGVFFFVTHTAHRWMAIAHY